MAIIKKLILLIVLLALATPSSAQVTFRKRTFSGTGTDNRYALFDGTSTLEAGLLSDDGTNVNLTSGNFQFQTDVILERDAAAILALRNSTTAQTFRVYESFTDASNNQGVFMDSGVTEAGFVTFGAFTNGTGTENVHIRISPAGSSRLHLGTGWIVEPLQIRQVSSFMILNQAGLYLRDTAIVRWSTTANAEGGSYDLFLDRESANTLRLSSDGSTGAANFLVTGSVGIGNASPQELLHVGAGTDASDITATDLLVP